MKIRCLIPGLLLASLGLSSYAQVTENYSYTPNLVVPDGNATGESDVQIIAGSAISAIGTVTVDLNISGNFNGDLYLYLRHEAESSPGTFATDGFSVLLNRVGRSVANPAGYADSGMQITLSDTAASGDLHGYHLAQTPAPGVPLTGTFQPDARAVDPVSALDSSPRSAFLNGFDGKPVDGRWTLFAADLQSGGTSQINSWSLNFSSVPEPGAYPWISASALLAFGIWRKKRGRG
jgi:hypothetical protein